MLSPKALKLPVGEQKHSLDACRSHDHKGPVEEALVEQAVQHSAAVAVTCRMLNSAHTQAWFSGPAQEAGGGLQAGSRGAREKVAIERWKRREGWLIGLHVFVLAAAGAPSGRDHGRKGGEQGGEQGKGAGQGWAAFVHPHRCLRGGIWAPTLAQHADECKWRPQGAVSAVAAADAHKSPPLATQAHRTLPKPMRAVNNVEGKTMQLPAARPSYLLILLLPAPFSVDGKRSPPPEVRSVQTLCINFKSRGTKLTAAARCFRAELSCGGHARRR